jgi:hypothetical protein
MERRWNRQLEELDDRRHYLPNWITHVTEILKSKNPQQKQQIIQLLVDHICLHKPYMTYNKHLYQHEWRAIVLEVLVEEKQQAIRYNHQKIDDLLRYYYRGRFKFRIKGGYLVMDDIVYLWVRIDSLDPLVVYCYDSEQWYYAKVEKLDTQLSLGVWIQLSDSSYHEKKQWYRLARPTSKLKPIRPVDSLLDQCALGMIRRELATVGYAKYKSPTTGIAELDERIVLLNGRPLQE